MRLFTLGAPIAFAFCSEDFRDVAFVARLFVSTVRSMVWGAVFVGLPRSVFGMRVVNVGPLQGSGFQSANKAGTFRALATKFLIAEEIAPRVDTGCRCCISVVDCCCCHRAGVCWHVFHVFHVHGR